MTGTATETHREWLNANLAIKADAEVTGKLGDTYHVETVLRFLWHTMSQTTRHQLMNHHPVSYWHIVTKEEGWRAYNSAPKS